MHHKLTIALLALLLSVSVHAIGVSPIRKVVDFEPGESIDLSLLLKNDGSDIKTIVYARGDLSPYVAIKDSLVTMGNDEQEKEARYVLNMPKSFDRPGVHKAELVVMEYPSSFGTGSDTAVSATASVVSELWLRVPYPGKYAEAALNIDSKDKIAFAINIMNFGIEGIQKAQAKIKIYGATYEEIASLETDAIGLKASEQKQLFAVWQPDVNPGKYHAVVELVYDGKKIELEQDFNVGILLIDIKRIDVKEFSLGQVAVFDILLESKWNERINGIYGEMTVLDEKGTEYTKFKTASTDIPAQGQALLKAYWDTSGINVGKYTLRLLIHYGEKATEKLIETEVNIDSIRTSLSPTAQVVAQKGLGKDTLLTVLVILLIVINIVWLVIFMRKKKK